MINISMNFGGFLYPMDIALRILKAKYQDDIEDMFVDLPQLKESCGEFITEVWDSIKPVTMLELMDSKSSIFVNTREENIGDKRRTLFRFLPLSLMYDNAEVVDERVVVTKQRSFQVVPNPPLSPDVIATLTEEQLQAYYKQGEKIVEVENGVIENVYRLKRLSVKKVFPEIKQPEFNGKKVTWMYAVEVTDTHTGKKYHLRVPADESFCKKGSYNAAAAVAWTCYVRIPVNYIESITRQGEVHSFKIKPDCVGKPWLNEAYHMSESDYFNLLNQQA